MTSTQIGLLVLQGMLSAVVALYVAVEWFKGKREQQKYKLYAIRDMLLDLAATKKFSDRDPLFKLFYRVINESISMTADMTFISFVRASVRARSELERKQRTEELIRRVESAPHEVRDFVAEFASTMMSIMMANSLILLFLLRVGYRGQTALRRVVSPSLFASQRQEVQTYRYFQDLHRVETFQHTGDSLHDCPVV